MISLVRNLLVQNVLKKKLCGDHLTHLRCISKSQHVKSIEYFMNNESPERLSESKSNKITRHLSTITYFKSRSAAVPKNKNQEFMSYFPGFVRNLRENADKYDFLGTGKHLERVLQYNVSGGKNYRGVIAVQAYELMAPKSSLTEENVKLSMYLGWCIEMFQTYMLMLDDAMDESLMRRGMPCWYKVEDIGMSCINDALMMEAGIYQILKDHFSHLDCYVKLLDLFHEITFVTCVGQYLDTRARYEDVLSFTMEKYKSIVTNKAFFYTFYFPIAATMYLAGNTDLEALQKAKSLLLEMSSFFQIQNDFLDCFGDPEVRDTIGTDIRTKKCTWLAVKCLERANEAQKTILKDNYGKKDKECIQRVKKLYEELSLPEVYENFEEEALNKLRTNIQQISLKFPVVELHMQYLTKLQKQEL